MKGQQPPPRILYQVLEVLIIITLGLVLAVSLVFFRLHVTMALTLLIGIWFLDAYLKNRYGFRNETLFADLSFAAFVFVGTQGISMVDQVSAGVSQTDSLLKLGVITFILLLLWLGNLSISRSLCEGGTPDSWSAISRYVAWPTSLLLAILSTCGAVLPLVVGLE